MKVNNLLTAALKPISVIVTPQVRGWELKDPHEIHPPPSIGGDPLLSSLFDADTG